MVIVKFECSLQDMQIGYNTIFLLLLVVFQGKVANISVMSYCIVVEW